MDAERLFDLIDGYVDGSIGAADQAELEAELIASPEARREFWMCVYRHALVRDILAEAEGRSIALEEKALGERDSEVQDVGAGVCRAAAGAARARSRRRRPPRVRRVTGGSTLRLLVGAIAAAVLVYYGIRQVAPDRRPGVPEAESAATADVERVTRPDAVIDSLEGAVQFLAAGTEDWARARGGAPVEPGDRLRTERSEARVLYATGTVLEVGRYTEVAFAAEGRARGLWLAGGKVLIETVPDDRGLFVETPEGRVVDLGTRFGVEVGPEGTAVSVAKGRVGVTTGSGTVTLVAGQDMLFGRKKAVPAPTGEPTAIAAPTLEPEEAPLPETPVVKAGNVLFVVGRVPLVPGDAAARRRLQSLGFDVALKGDSVASLHDAEGKAAVVVSSTVDSGAVKQAFRDLGTPIVTWETWLYDDLGMTGPTKGRDYGYVEGKGRALVMTGVRHPLAAGLTGTVRVASSEKTGWGRPQVPRAGGGAITIATLGGRPDRAAIFAYERGAAMHGRRAPARRVGLFMFDDSAASFTPPEWALFDAAIRWCAEDAGNRRP